MRTIGPAGMYPMVGVDTLGDVVTLAHVEDETIQVVSQLTSLQVDRLIAELHHAKQLLTKHKPRKVKP